MRKLLFTLLLLGFSISGFSQVLSACENVTTFSKNSKPDLGIVIYSGDAETVWNALRLATISQSKGDTVVVFVLGKGLDVFMSENKTFDIKGLSDKFWSNGGQILTCATCAKLRGTEEVKSCTITSIVDLYEIVKKSKKILSF
jgi:peroxiredoxin family protein